MIFDKQYATNRKLATKELGQHFQPDPKTTSSPSQALDTPTSFQDKYRLLAIPTPKAHKIENVKVDLAIIVGGDGTLIGVARNMVHSDTPLIGVNQGRFGFLADLNTNSMFSNIDTILNGEFIEDKRMLINTKIMRGNKKVYESLSLNDVVIKSGVRLIELDVIINDAFVHRQRSDGIIVSTPTGTTAYALSAGGPILHPNLDAISIVPISPHTLSNRPIAVNAESQINIKIINMNEAYASIDGQIKFPLDIRDVIQISKAKESISILHPKDYCYFEMLRNKLNWG